MTAIVTAAHDNPVATVAARRGNPPVDSGCSRALWRAAMGAPEPSPAAGVRSVFISDVHLGTRACQPERLLESLRAYESENLFLPGDIVDFRAMKSRGIYWVGGAEHGLA